MAKTRVQVRDSIKSKLGRSISGSTIDTIIEDYINHAVELFSNILSPRYDVSEWDHTFSSTEVSNNTVEYQLPTGIKYIHSATYIDTSDTDNYVYYPLKFSQTVDLYNMSKFEGGDFRSAAMPSLDYTVDSFTFFADSRRSSGHRSQTGRVDRQQIPTDIIIKGVDIEIYPQLPDDAVGNIFRLVTQDFPDALTADASTNSITTYYPEALEAYTAGLFTMLYLRDHDTGGIWLSQAGSMLRGIATKQQIELLTNAFWKP